MHDKSQAIFNFDTSWWINRNTVDLLRLKLILALNLWGKKKWGVLSTWGWVTLFSFQNVFYLKCLLILILFPPWCSHTTLLALLLQKNQGIMWLANTNGYALNSMNRQKNDTLIIILKIQGQESSLLVLHINVKNLHYEHISLRCSQMFLASSSDSFATGT